MPLQLQKGGKEKVLFGCLFWGGGVWCLFGLVFFGLVFFFFFWGPQRGFFFFFLGPHHKEKGAGFPAGAVGPLRKRNSAFRGGEKKVGFSEPDPTSLPKKGRGGEKTIRGPGRKKIRSRWSASASNSSCLLLVQKKKREKKKNGRSASFQRGAFRRKGES